MFCSLCGTELANAPSIDAIITRYRCPAGHLFYTGERPRGEIPDPLHVREPKKVGDRQLIEFWLSNADARRQLPDDLATVCRRLIDLESVDVGPQEDFWPRPVKCCFVCGGPTRREGDDLYLDGHLCGQGHQTWDRGGHIYLQRTTLSIEPTSWSAARVADYWLGHSQHGESTKPYISANLRAAIQRLRSSLGSSEIPWPS